MLSGNCEVRDSISGLFQRGSPRLNLGGTSAVIALPWIPHPLSLGSFRISPVPIICSVGRRPLARSIATQRIACTRRMPRFSITCHECIAVARAPPLRREAKEWGWREVVFEDVRCPFSPPHAPPISQSAPSTVGSS